MPNILEYIQVLQKFFLPLQIYKKLLDCLNLIYIVYLSVKLSLKISIL